MAAGVGASAPTCHGESAHQQPDVAAAHNDGLAALPRAAAVLGSPRGPYSNQQYEKVEHHDGYQPFHLESAGSWHPVPLKEEHWNRTFTCGCQQVSFPSISIQQLNLVLGLQETEKIGDAV